MSTKEHILIVEDDPFWSDNYSKLLKDIFVCKIATSYVEAIKILKTSVPLALILDLKLGDSNYDEDGWGGWQLAESAKKQGVSSIVVTGYPKYSRASRAFRDFGVIDFFSKKDFPDIKTVFVQRVQEATEETKRQQQGKFKKKRNLRPTNLKRENNVFISYCHKDRKWLNKIATHLKVLTNKDKITTWDDTKIKSGSNWKEEIHNALSEAKIAILLITPDFLASDFITNNELPFLFKAAKKKGLIILWVAVKSSLYEETYIAKLQAANDPSRPLASLTTAKAEQEIVQICKKVKDAAK